MSGKQCSACTACCQGWLKASINGETMKPGKPCQHLGDQGCTIYADRPEDPCVKYVCGWLVEQNKMPEHMKPSECGAIVGFSEWRGRQVVDAVPVGKAIPAKTLEWLMAFAKEKSIPLTFSERILENGEYIGIKRIGFGPPSFIRAVQDRLEPEDVMRF